MGVPWIVSLLSLFGNILEIRDLLRYSCQKSISLPPILGARMAPQVVVALCIGKPFGICRYTYASWALLIYTLAEYLLYHFTTNLFSGVPHKLVMSSLK